MLSVKDRERSYLKREAELLSKLDNLSRNPHTASGPTRTGSGRSVVKVEIQDGIPSHPLGSVLHLVFEDVPGLANLLSANADEIKV